MFIEIIDDDSNKQIEREKGSTYNEEHEVQIHVNICLSNWLLSQLEQNENIESINKENNRMESKVYFILQFLLAVQHLSSTYNLINLL